ncbi:MAG: hypothetical protein LBC70_05020 [Chitinispirillales bacterium]|nr:hypothetical protein [Chitinispirillales bacterium]
MTTMTLTAKSYADLELFEILAKRLGVSVEVGDVEDRKRAAAVEAFRELAAESQSAAKKAGLTPNDLDALIKEVRGKTRNVKEKNKTCA